MIRRGWSDDCSKQRRRSTQDHEVPAVRRKAGGYRLHGFFCDRSKVGDDEVDGDLNGAREGQHEEDDVGCPCCAYQTDDNDDQCADKSH
jgi:hypothetical protein